MPKNSCIMQIWAESGKSALPICNYSQILYQFLTFTQNLKRSQVPKHPYFPKPLAKSARLVYNQLRNRRILVCPTVAQSETYKALSLLTDYRLSPIGVEDSLSVYLRLRLLSMYVKAANTTSKSVSTSKVFIPTSFLFPERTTARLSLLL